MVFQVDVKTVRPRASPSRWRGRGHVRTREEALHALFEEAGKELDPSKVKTQTLEEKDGADMAAAVRKANEELSLIGKRVGEFDELDKIRTDNQKRLDTGKTFRDETPAPGPEGWRRGPSPGVQILGQLFAESKALQAAKDQPGRQLRPRRRRCQAAPPDEGELRHHGRLGA